MVLKLLHGIVTQMPEVLRFQLGIEASEKPVQSCAQSHTLLAFGSSMHLEVITTVVKL